MIFLLKKLSVLNLTYPHIMEPLRHSSGEENLYCQKYSMIEKPRSSTSMDVKSLKLNLRRNTSPL